MAIYEEELVKRDVKKLEVSTPKLNSEINLGSKCVPGYNHYLTSLISFFFWIIENQLTVNS